MARDPAVALDDSKAADAAGRTAAVCCCTTPCCRGAALSEAAGREAGCACQVWAAALPPRGTAGGQGTATLGGCSAETGS
mmetsp:Transcript_86899/g.246368  ORF Transcript_86899/g.246368 Transcript_86899/m.246368 type:complete len:80 (+) Transcript_86899:440-679(+)